MKKVLFVLVLGLAALMAACSGSADAKASAEPGKANGEVKEFSVVVDRPDADLSYAFGASVGTSIRQVEIKLDYNAFLQGVKDTAEKEGSKISMDEANAKIRTALTTLRDLKTQKAKEEGEKFLADNKSKEGVKTTASGLQYKVITEGTGAKPGATTTVKVHYTGKLLDGKVFDSSVERGEPATFALNGVIPGWTEGLQLMTVGSKYTFWIPAALGYGENGTPDGSIGPNSVLNFEVELLEIVSPAKN